MGRRSRSRAFDSTAALRPRVVLALGQLLAVASLLLVGFAPPAEAAAAGLPYDSAEFTYDTSANAAMSPSVEAAGVVAPIDQMDTAISPVAQFVGHVYDSSPNLVAPSGIPRLGSVGDEVAAARSHLGTIPDALEYGPNRAMLNSIDDAVASGRPLTTAERNFLDHELLEASYVGQGMTQEAAHALTLQTVPAASNYSPAVIRQFPDHFSDYYFDYWGISR